MSTTYDVFARKEYPEPLIYIGSVEVDDPTQASKTVLEKYGPESAWLEMVIVPHEEIIVVFSS